jgi:hypothetical protein
MTKYRRVRQLSPPDAAYIAGVIDGEGSIHLTRRHKGDYRQLVISISNTEIALLEYVLEVVGAGRITSKVTYQPGHSPSYTYVIENRQALALLTQIDPYLRSYKSVRARLVLDHYIRLTPRNGKYTESQLAERAEFVRSFFLITAHGKQSNRLTDGV